MRGLGDFRWSVPNSPPPPQFLNPTAKEKQSGDFKESFSQAFGGLIPLWHPGA